MSAAAGRRLKVCFVVPSLAGGGAERVAVQVLNALDATRWDRSMFLFEPSGPYLADLSPSIRLEAPAGAVSPGRLARWNALRRFIRRARPDVIVLDLEDHAAADLGRGRNLEAKVVFAVGPDAAFRSDADYRWSRPWTRWLLSTAMRIGCTVTDLVLASSQGVADDLIASFHGQSARVRVINNPVDLAAVAAAAGEPLDAHDAAQWRRPVVVAAGRLADVKNYPLLIDAFAILRQRTAASLFVLGEGDREASLRQRIHERGLDDCVHLCGFRANPWSYIARADVFALTSRYEGFGNVIVEAMACGVPVVATSSPGTREILTSGANGLLVDDHEPAAFAAALAAVIDDDALRGKMADSARRHAERFRTESIALAYDRVLTEALA
jgi:glycosyltransferase involved in cell wall biosynthesis